MEGRKKKEEEGSISNQPTRSLGWAGRARRCWELRVRRGHPTPTLFSLIVLTLRLPLLGVSSWTTTL